MAESEGISIMPWSPLAGGFLSGKFTRNKEVAGDSRRDTFDFPPINKEKAYDIIDMMNEIAKNHNVSTAAVALNWVINQPAITSTIIGAKNLQQLTENIASTSLQLTPQDRQRLDEVSALTPEYPGWMVNRQLQGRWPS
jgi:aryl-alcohol dehydrogenase-like predicted oxidoreductase